MDEKQLQQLIVLAGIAPQIAPVNLSKTKSVNLHYVVSYEPLEPVNDDGEPSGEITPGVTLANSQTMLFTDEENKIFRRAWNAYTEANATRTELLQSLLAASRAAAAQPAQQSTL